eukprot:GHVP01063624.1.p1 GENE.GHVP01063624.1~~GHVP01063624.1.p1  ORF type:complete len:290 (+),score=50.60 GHVP01063624.1:762-1631(+)
MQIFKTKFNDVEAGDRVAFRLPNLKSSAEQGLMYEEGKEPLPCKTFGVVIGLMPFYNENLLNLTDQKREYEFCFGNRTVIGTIRALKLVEGVCSFKEISTIQTAYRGPRAKILETLSFDQEGVFEPFKNSEEVPEVFCAVLSLKQSIFANEGSCFVASDSVVAGSKSASRFVFFGKIDAMLHERTEGEASGLRIVRVKEKEGKVVRVNNNQDLIIEGMFQNGNHATLFLGMKVDFSGGSGVVSSLFGKGKKVLVKVQDGVDFPEVGSLVKIRYVKSLTNSKLSQPWLET